MHSSAPHFTKVPAPLVVTGASALLLAPIVVMGTSSQTILDSKMILLTSAIVVIAASFVLGRALQSLPFTKAIVVVMALRVPLVALEPVLSDDIYRYVHEGRAGRVALDVPYRFAPANVSLPFDDDVSTRVNHRDIPAAYPPFSQLLLLVVTRVGDALHAPLAALKGSLLAVDALLIGLLAWVRRSLSDPHAPLVYGTHPLPLVALGLGPHLDVMGALLVMSALVLGGAALGPMRTMLDGGVTQWRARSVAAGFLIGLAVLVKPIAVLAIAALPLRARAVVGVVLGVVLPSAPYLFLGAPLLDGIVAYGSRWRASPILFPLFEALFSSWDRTRVAQDTWMHLHVATDRFGVLLEEGGRALFTVGHMTPDAVRILVDGALFARLLAALTFVIVFIVVVTRRQIAGTSRLAVLFTAFLLLTPTLHPWYFLWMLPLGAALGARALTWMSSTALVLYVPKLSELSGDGWSESAWTSAALVAALTLGALQDRRRARDGRA